MKDWKMGLVTIPIMALIMTIIQLSSLRVVFKMAASLLVGLFLGVVWGINFAIEYKIKKWKPQRGKKK